MNDDFVEIVHPDVEGTGLVSVDSLEHWLVKGWELAHPSDVTAPVSLEQDTPDPAEEN